MLMRKRASVLGIGFILLLTINSLGGLSTAMTGDCDSPCSSVEWPRPLFYGLLSATGAAVWLTGGFAGWWRGTTSWPNKAGVLVAAAIGLVYAAALLPGLAYNVRYYGWMFWWWF